MIKIILKHLQIIIKNPQYKYKYKYKIVKLDKFQENSKSIRKGFLYKKNKKDFYS